MDFKIESIRSFRQFSQHDKGTERISRKSSHTGDAVREHVRSEAERIVAVLAKELGLPTKREDLMRLRNSDSRKVVSAALIKSRTAGQTIGLPSVWRWATLRR